MTVTVAHGVSLDELRALFTGVPIEPLLDTSDPWSTTPCYDVGLATVIAHRTASQTEYALRSVLYDSTAVDEVPARAVEVIRLAAQRYRQHLELQRASSKLRRGRGL